MPAPTKVSRMEKICDICNKQKDDIQERYVPTKQTLMEVCKKCRHTYITYSPESMGTLETGDVHLDD